MTVESRVCPNCQQAIDAGDSTCPQCGQGLEPGSSSWPTWHGAPTGETGEAWMVEDEEITGQDVDSFEELTLDPSLTNVPVNRRGNRPMVGALLVSALVWIVAEIVFWVDTPASFWDVVWYVAGVVTIGLGIWLLVLLWQRSRTHGWHAAVRWLTS